MRTRKSNTAGTLTADPHGVEELPGVPSASVQAVVGANTTRSWIKVVIALIVLAAILMFVSQNSRQTKVSFATASGRIPLAVALLGSAVLGALLVLALGSIRTIQLRRTIRRSSPDAK